MNLVHTVFKRGAPAWQNGNMLEMEKMQSAGLSLS